MSTIHNAGPDTENSDASRDAEDKENQNADFLDSESEGHHSPKGDSDPTIKNH